MSVPETLPTTRLETEWERVIVLAQCLQRARQNQDVPEDLLKQLERLQQQVAETRHPNGPWGALHVDQLNTLELDILACAVAPEAEPRVGWLFQDLQPGAPQPYPTPALLQDLLALRNDAAGELHAALSEDAVLRGEHLIRIEDEGVYQPIRPASGITSRLLGRPAAVNAPRGALRVRGRAGWDDLVLPRERTRMLREWLLWVRHRDRVVEEWGGGFTGGPVALFSGPSGTGKTFAAVVLATELGWPLYRVDIGKLVSKYIGETEKNLNRLFDAAHGQPMVLQFDEADSLFSKRGEVKEARDRYANMEVSHLLARIEEHCGPCILTTNLRDHLDQAFTRRFHMVVDFPRPDSAARTRLWERLLPPRAPREPDLRADFLGPAVNLTGGGMRNAALHSAYLAAGDGKPIGRQHVALAVWRELSKDGRELSLSDLGPLAAFLPEGVRGRAIDPGR